MNRLTTNEEFPHGAEGKRADKLTGYWCRGEFEATACVEKLSRYENTGLEPEEIEALIHRWIPVEERLPKTSGTMREDEKLLILLPDGMRTVSFYISTSSGRKMFFDGWDTYNPIAWMPLPEPYKEAEG